MPNRTLALEVGSATLKAVLVESTLRAQRVLGFYAVPRTGPDVGADLRTLATTHHLEWDEVVAALAGELVTHRILTLPFADRKRLDQTVPFELETHLPFELDDAVVDYQVLGTNGEGAAVLAALAPKAAVRAQLAALAAAGVDPRVLDLAPLAALNVLRATLHATQADVVLVMLDPGSGTVALLRGGRLAGLRTLGHGLGANGDLTALVREIRWSVIALAGADTDAAPALEVWLGGEGARRADVRAALADALGAAPRTIATLLIDSVPAALRAEQAAFAAPLGLALRDGADAFGVDFRRGEFAYHREREALWRSLATAGVLALVALVLMVTSFVLEGHRLGARRDALRSEIRQLFTTALPDVRTVVNEKAQLASEIATLEKQRALYGGLAPSTPRTLDVLRALTQSAPTDVGLEIEELAVDGDTVRIRGSTRAYEGVEAMKRGLAARPEFHDVQAKDVRASVDGQRVDFRLALTLGGGAGS